MILIETSSLPPPTPKMTAPFFLIPPLQILHVQLSNMLNILLLTAPQIVFQSHLPLTPVDPFRLQIQFQQSVHVEGLLAFVLTDINGFCNNAYGLFLITVEMFYVCEHHQVLGTQGYHVLG